MFIRLLQGVSGWIVVDALLGVLTGITNRRILALVISHRLWIDSSIHGSSQDLEWKFMGPSVELR